jgi:glycyl-tRNA synthetase beta chain
MKNILDQAEEKGFEPAGTLNPELFQSDAERELARKRHDVATEIAGMSSEAGFVPILERMATLRPEVDDFFEAVMVMDHDPAVRANRLRLLWQTLTEFSFIADFSEIVTEG